MFQSTPPHEGRLRIEMQCRDERGFNPRPRMRGDSTCFKPAITKDLHALFREPKPYTIKNYISL